MLKLADLAMREDFSLGPLWVSPALRLIKGPAGELHVEPLIMQVFLLLADAKGQVVTRNRLYDECWGGVDVGDYSLNRAITMVRRIAAEAGPGSFTIESIPRTGYRLLVEGETEPTPVPTRRKPALLVTAALGAIVLAGAGWFFVSRGPSDPAIAIQAAAGGRAADLGDGIASAAMWTASTFSAPVDLLDNSTSNGSRTAFLLRVREAPIGGQRKIDLTLISNPDKSVLWNWSATQPNEQAAVLEEEARMIGASAIACAAETRAKGVRPAEEGTVRLYLDACSKFQAWHGAALTWLVDAFEKVTVQAPQLRGAWSKLFLAKAEAIEGFPPVDMVGSLKQDIKRSEANRIDVPETYIAKAAVLPLNARFERLQLYEAGLKRYPSSLFLLTARSWQLRSLGRMDEAASTAQRAAALYPESPAANTEYANSLMFSGRTDAARAVLNRAMKSAPEAPNLKSSLWRLESRYGDPKAALEIARNCGCVVDPSLMSLIQARINPTKANVDRTIAEMLRLYREDPRAPDFAAQGMGTFGRNEDAIRLLLGFKLGGNSGDGAETLFRPTMRGVRRDPRFMQIAKIFGVTDYWIRSGILPDFCYEPDLPYDCRRELAKLRT